MTPWTLDLPFVFAAEIAPLDLAPSTRWLLGGALALYLVVLTTLSVLAARRVNTQEDYLVAGRSLPLFLCWGSLIATWFGAETMTASSEAARESGLLGVILDPFACSVTLVYSGLVFAGPLWRMKLLTTGDYFRRTYGPTVEIVAACLQVPVFFGWIAVQYTALAGMLAVYFGLPVPIGILFACGVTLAFTMIGGMWSVTVTDTLQIVIAFAGLLVLSWTIFAQFGDGSMLAGVDRMLTQTDPALLTIIPPFTTPALMAYTAAWASGVFGNVSGQDVHQRIFSAKDARTATLACVLAGVVYFCMGLIPVSLGLVSRLVEPDAKGDILQILAGRFLTPALAVIFVVSFTSVVVSTATSAVLAPATILSHNLLGRWSVFRGRGLFVDRLCVLLMSLAALPLAFSSESKMELLELAVSLQLVSFCVPMHMGLYGRPRSLWSALLPMGLGFTCYLLRWLPEHVFLRPPEDFTGEYGDYVAGLLTVPFWQSTVRIVLTVPEALYGLGASVLGYVIAQGLYRRTPPINDQTLKDAWGNEWTKSR
ncbi:MAG: sodium:solute symporter [Planctomycetaceae bacterium]|nr:sodium:solute symporter [Planctomycetaceae bacterium]